VDEDTRASGESSRYRSQIDRSIPPYAVRITREYGKDPKQKCARRLLHGRDSSIPEAKSARLTAGTRPKRSGYVQGGLGRGNKASVGAGGNEVRAVAGVCAAEWHKADSHVFVGKEPFGCGASWGELFLRGCSMGGFAGT